MTAAAVARLYPDSTSADAATPRRVAVDAALQPSARTIALTSAADLLRNTLDQLAIDHRLTAAEVSVLLAGEMTRHARHELAYERQMGHGVPVSLRYVLPPKSDARVDEALDAVDSITDVALHR